MGVSVAKTIATYFNIPLIPVNHLHGHLYAQYDQTSIPFPYCGLIISGGHTSMVHVKDHGQFELIGQTRDDAAGEVFDKVARCLGLGYPGGPVVEKEARQGDPKRFSFPIPMKHSLNLAFQALKLQLFKSFNLLMVTFASSRYLRKFSIWSHPGPIIQSQKALSVKTAISCPIIWRCFCKSNTSHIF